MISTEQGSDSKHQETNKKASRGIHKEIKQKREDGRDHENQQIHGREEAKHVGRGRPRSSCEVQVPYNQSLAPPNHILIHEILQVKQTLFTPEQRWGQDGSSAGWQSGLEMGSRLGNNLSLFHILLILQIKTVPILFHFLLAWDSTLSLSAQRRKPPDYRPVGASSTLEQLSGRRWSHCYHCSCEA